MRSRWYPIMRQLHRFMIAVARVTVNHDGKGGTAPDPLSSWPSWFLEWALVSGSW